MRSELTEAWQVADQGPDQPQGPSVYLQPAQLHVAVTPATVRTVLGSCVAACLYDQRRGIGGLNHFVLPASPPVTEDGLRYGDQAMRALIAGLLAAGAEPASLRAKLFGGAHVLAALGRRVGSGSPPTPLGLLNVAAARAVLREARVPITAEDVGGTHGRRLIFCTSTGRAWVALLGGGAR